jgi:hypothetical protein
METDPYLEMIQTQFDKILMVYKTFSKLKPILEFDVVEQKLYSYPASDYINNLSSRTREPTRGQYAEATKNGQFLLFVKDTKNQRLRSYVFDQPDSL